jgi:trehalose 6-phosphate phosphatase
MKDILSTTCRPVLHRFAWANVLVAFDFDGTLAPIVAKPDAASMRTRTRSLLAEVAKRYPCVVISGRARSDVARRVAGVGLRRVIGNHGVEPWQSTPAVSSQVARWRAALEPELAGLRGVSVEDKTYSLAVHYRNSREKKRARAVILDAIARLEDVRLVGGKLVFNVIPRDAPHKGIALERERDLLGCDTAIYVGDDETDEDVFGLPTRERLLAIRVGSSQASRADYCIRGQQDIERLLEALLSQRGRDTVNNGA